MNQEETIALWQQCETARGAALAEGKSNAEAHEAATALWNGWAKAMLQQKEQLESCGLWQTGEEQPNWRGRAAADFSSLRFLAKTTANGAEAQADEFRQGNGRASSVDVGSLQLETDTAGFRGWIFPGDAFFCSAKFDGSADFHQAQFSRDAGFLRAQFSREAEFERALFGGRANFAQAHFARHAQFESARFSDAGFEGAKFCHSAGFLDVEFRSDAGFAGAKFSGDARFIRTAFRSYTEFRGAQFNSSAVFHGAQFSDYAGFNDAQFSGDASFSEARFGGKATFEQAKFGGAARFAKAQFTSVARFVDAEFDHAQFLSPDHIADFSQVNFAARTSYKCCLFRAEANFDAIRVESSFDLAAATFEVLPSFIQASFKEAPRFDHLILRTPHASSEPKETLCGALCIARQTKWGCIRVSDKEKAEARTTTSKFRALKALAIKAHDGEREHLFFKGEMRARRISEGENWTVRCGNVAYDLSSDFGHSFLRPSIVWIILLFVVVVAYAGGSMSTPLGHRCGSKALFLGVRNGLVLLSIAKDHRVTDAYLCLFGPQMAPSGTPPDPVTLPAALKAVEVPNIPEWMTLIEIFQTFFSSILIFLIALAVRNQLKIK